MLQSHNICFLLSNKRVSLHGGQKIYKKGHIKKAVTRCGLVKEVCEITNVSTLYALVLYHIIH